jgi:ATP-dependent protease ClpP protease subunit
MNIIDVDGLESAGRRDRFFARSAGTRFDIRAASTDVTEIDLYDEIGFWGVTASMMRSRLRDAKGDITLRINSPGGDVFDGVAIYNDLVAHQGKVRVEITGLAASIATIIAMAGDEIAIADNAFFMIHNSWVLTIGDRHDHQQSIDIMEKIDDSLARTYASRSKVGIRAVKQMMDDETWLTGKEAREQGFADSALAATQAKAKFDLSVFGKVPDALRYSDADFAAPETETDIEKLLMRDAGRSRSQARALIKSIRAGKTSTTEAMRDAGGVRLDELAEAARAVRETTTHR